MNASKVNWFPGHMKKATDKIRDKIKSVDLIIEVLDARDIINTSNPDLYPIIQNKPILKVALKKDLSDYTNATDVLIGSSKEISFKKKIIDALYQKMGDKINKLKSKGLINPEFLVMVIGIPNVGKSTLINFLAPKKTLKVENRAGVTKSQESRRININFNLIDTPGILTKNINNLEDGYKLALINCINKEILPIYDVIKYGYEYLLKYYQKKLFLFYGMEKELIFDDFLEHVCLRKNYKSINNGLDIDRAIDKLYIEFTNCEISRINYCH